MSSALAKIGLVKLDRLCDAKFINSLVKTTKTDFAILVNKNAELKAFLGEIEKLIEDDHNKCKLMIQEYLELISSDILQFRSDLKEIKRQEKLRKKEIEREAMKAELRREMASDEKKQAILDKIGITTEEKKPLNFKQAKSSDIKISESQMQTMDIGTFYDFLRETVKNNLLIIKSDEGKMTIRDIDLDENTGVIKIKIGAL